MSRETIRNNSLTFSDTSRRDYSTPTLVVALFGDDDLLVLDFFFLLFLLLSWNINTPT